MARSNVLRIDGWRMAFKIAAGVGIGENNASQSLAIDFGLGAIDGGSEDDRAKPFDNEVARWLLRKESVTDGIGIEPMKAETSKHTGRQTLAGSDPADEADHRNRTVRRGASRLERPVHPMMSRFVT